MLLHIRNRATGPARKLRRGTALSRWLLQQVNASPGDHLVMGNHRAQYTRSGWALLEQGASLNLPLGPVRRGKVTLPVRFDDLTDTIFAGHHHQPLIFRTATRTM
jgi:hypothetical protein